MTIESTDLLTSKPTGEYLAVDPVGLAAGTYLIENFDGRKPNGTHFAVQRATNVDTGAQSVRIEAGGAYGAWTAVAASAIGYAIGAGGTVTQLTSITTGVTLNKVCGKITTVPAATAAGAEDTFTVTNSLVGVDDVVVPVPVYAGAGTPQVFCSKVAAGSFDITIANLHATLALNAAMVINFVVIKSVAA